MTKDDMFLGLEMCKLEIEPMKLNKKGKTEDNPFVPFMPHRNMYRRSQLQNKCSCSVQRKHTSSTICKKKPNKILKEPVLKLLSCYDNCNTVSRPECLQSTSQDHFHTPILKRLQSDALSLCSLVQTCNQLKISSGSNEDCSVADLVNETKWWKNSISASVEARDSKQNNVTSTCSQQALNPTCDVTIDELASYFETLVHIPKKMSSMAEMMYI